jgi:hypothetical protein
MNTGSECCNDVVACPPVWRGVELDRVPVSDWHRVLERLLAIDAAGVVVAMSPSAATWANVTAWQVRGRHLLRELHWVFGRAATERILAFARSSDTVAVVAATGGHRRATGVAELRLLRGRERIYITVVH